MDWLPCWMARRFARAAGSEWSAYLRSPMLIPFSCDDVLPPKQSAKHWFVCSFLQVPVWYINFSKADFILQWFECVTLQAGAEAALRLQRTAEECSNGAWQAREKCSKWVHCGLRVNNFLGGFDLALVHTAQTSKQLMKASLALNTLRIEWSASAAGQLFKPFVRPRLWLVLQLRMGWIPAMKPICALTSGFWRSLGSQAQATRDSCPTLFLVSACAALCLKH